MRAVLLCLPLLTSACRADSEALAAAARARLPADDGFATRLCHAALDQTRHQVRYDGAYVRIAYPGGDVPADTGVCTDVVIRGLRVLGFDLQQLARKMPGILSCDQTAEREHRDQRHCRNPPCAPSFSACPC